MFFLLLYFHEKSIKIFLRTIYIKYLGKDVTFLNLNRNTGIPLKLDSQFTLQNVRFFSNCFTWIIKKTRNYNFNVEKNGIKSILKCPVRFVS